MLNLMLEVRLEYLHAIKFVVSVVVTWITRNYQVVSRAKINMNRSHLNLLVQSFWFKSSEKSHLTFHFLYKSRHKIFNFADFL